MSDNDLKGISTGHITEESEINVDEVKQLLTELEVGNFSDLTDNQLTAIREILAAEEELEGITQSFEGGEGREIQIRQKARVLADIEQEDLFQQQLEELEGITDDIEVLKSIAANTATTNSLIETQNSLLTDLVEATTTGAALGIRDVNHVDFTRGNDPRGVIDDDDKNTSIVIIKADSENDEFLYVGEDDLRVNNGFRIDAGETQAFRINVLEGDFQIVAEESGDGYSYMALGLGEE